MQEKETQIIEIFQKILENQEKQNKQIKSILDNFQVLFIFGILVPIVFFFITLSHFGISFFDFFYLK